MGAQSCQLGTIRSVVLPPEASLTLALMCAICHVTTGHRVAFRTDHVIFTAAVLEIATMHVFATPLLRFVQICLRLLQVEVKLLLKLRFPGPVQMCPDRVHMKPVCMHACPSV